MKSTRCDSSEDSHFKFQLYIRIRQLCNYYIFARQECRFKKSKHVQSAEIDYAYRQGLDIDRYSLCALKYTRKSKQLFPTLKNVLTKFRLYVLEFKTVSENEGNGVDL
jgi:hypothetical protein